MLGWIIKHLKLENRQENKDTIKFSLGTSASSQDWVIGRQTYPLLQTIRIKIDRIYKTTVFKYTGYQAKDSDPWQQTKEVRLTTVLTSCLERCPSPAQGRERKPSLSWRDRVGCPGRPRELKFTGQSAREEKTAQKDSCKGFPKEYLAQHWSDVSAAKFGKGNTLDRGGEYFHQAFKCTLHARWPPQQGANAPRERLRQWAPHRPWDRSPGWSRPNMGPQNFHYRGNIFF